jgi:hypothetical protein
MSERLRVLMGGWDAGNLSSNNVVVRDLFGAVGRSEVANAVEFRQDCGESLPRRTLRVTGESFE